MTWLSRYRTGERTKVWREIARHGDLSPAQWLDATRVAHETMLRARSNVETLVGRLRTTGYAFEGEGHRKPPKTVERKLARFETKVGVIPLALRAFWEEVGSVDFRGTHPVWAPATGFANEEGDDVLYTDPLFVASLEENVFDYETRREDEGEDEEAPRAHYDFLLAPDRYHKANVSGGFSERLSREEPPEVGLHVIESLHQAFAYGGFPGLAKERRSRAWVASMTEGLVDIY